MHNYKKKFQYMSFVLFYLVIGRYLINLCKTMLIFFSFKNISYTKLCKKYMQNMYKKFQNIKNI